MITIIAHKLNQDLTEELQVPNVLLHRVGFTYLHGILEIMNGYDIFSYLTGHEPQCESNGATVKVYLDKCTIVYARQFVWTCEYNRWHGLIVMMGDTQAEEYARKKFHEKSFIL